MTNVEEINRLSEAVNGLLDRLSHLPGVYPLWENADVASVELRPPGVLSEVRVRGKIERHQDSVALIKNVLREFGYKALGPAGHSESHAGSNVMEFDWLFYVQIAETPQLIG